MPTDFNEILKDNRFDVQTIRGRHGDMRKAVERRLSDGQAWHWAIIRGEKSGQRGMMLVRVTTNKFEALYLTQANCGAKLPSTRYTASILYVLGIGKSEREVFDRLQEHHSFVATNIHPHSEPPPTLERLG